MKTRVLKQEEYEEFYEGNDGCSRYESDLDIDAEDDPYGQVSVGDLEYNVYGLGLAENASEEAKIKEQKRKKVKKRRLNFIK